MSTGRRGGRSKGLAGRTPGLPATRQNTALRQQADTAREETGMSHDSPVRQSPRRTTGSAGGNQDQDAHDRSHFDEDGVLIENPVNGSHNGSYSENQPPTVRPEDEEDLDDDDLLNDDEMQFQRREREREFQHRQETEERELLERQERERREHALQAERISSLQQARRSKQRTTAAEQHRREADYPTGTQERQTESSHPYRPFGEDVGAGASHCSRGAEGAQPSYDDPGAQLGIEDQAELKLLEKKRDLLIKKARDIQDEHKRHDEKLRGLKGYSELRVDIDNYQLWSDLIKTKLAQIEVLTEKIQVILSQNDQRLEADMDRICELEKKLVFFRNGLENRVELWKALNPLVKVVKEQEQDAMEPCYRPARERTGLKTPKMSVPKFSGKYEDFQGFKDLFNALVDRNSEISDVEKLTFLREACEASSATNIVKTFSLSEDNYKLAYKALCQRYDNKKCILKSHVDTLQTLKACSKENGLEMRRLLEAFRLHLAALKSTGAECTTKCAFQVALLISKLDPETRKQYDLANPSDEPYEVEDLLGYIDLRARALEYTGAAAGGKLDQGLLKHSNHKVAGKQATVHVGVAAGIQAAHTAGSGQHTSSSGFQAPRRTQFGATSTPKPTLCAACQGTSHRTYQCTKFIAADIGERKLIVFKGGLCYNCLNSTHRARECVSDRRCRTCGSKHHSLLHHEAPASAQADETKGKTSPESLQTDCVAGCGDTHPGPQVQVCEQKMVCIAAANAAKSGQTVLLATVQVSVSKTDTGTKLGLRALMDTGAQASLITEDACSRLGLAKVCGSLIIKGLGEHNTQSKSKVSFFVYRQDGSAYLMEAYVLCAISGNLPSSEIQIRQIKGLQKVNLADEKFFVPSPVDLLLGADVYYDLTLDARFMEGSICFQNTVFGWTLAGQVKLLCGNGAEDEADSNMVLSFTTQVPNLQRFWENEEIPGLLGESLGIKPPRKLEEIFCEQHFDKTTRRNAAGRFVVKLPFKGDVPQLGHSFSTAEKRFYNLERKLDKEPVRYEQYREFMNEFIELGHMVLVPDSEINIKPQDCFYCPHHCVDKDSTTTKLRVVFDASAKTSSGISLNDRLAVGPKLQADLLELLLVFRQYRVAMAADVTKMYRMVELDLPDQDFHRILWRNASTDKLRVYRMTRVTYGVASSCYHAVKCLQLAAEIASNVSSATAILERFYVDDFLGGAKTISEAIALRKALTSDLNGTSFHLRKWATNRPEVVSDLPESEKQDKAAYDIQDEKHQMKVLGMSWFPIRDVFNFQVNHVEDASPEKISACYAVFCRGEKKLDQEINHVKVDNKPCSSRQVKRNREIGRRGVVASGQANLPIGKNTLLHNVGYEHTVRQDDNQLQTGCEGEKITHVIAFACCDDVGHAQQHVETSVCMSECLPQRMTKRQMLSDISKMFDPLGLIGPVTLRLKIFMQRLWVENIEWDEPMPADMLEDFLGWRRRLVALRDLEIPRCILAPGQENKVELHVFCDASEKGMAACLYVRVVDGEGRVNVTLLTAKTRVAPTKHETVPRLELGAALLGVHLMERVKMAYTKEGVTILGRYAWTDSTVVLCWLKSPSKTWATYVANRVAQIQTVCVDRWYHVPTGDNPADVASRGLPADELKDHPLWWTGPAWLVNWEENLPAQPQHVPTDSERRKVEEPAVLLTVVAHAPLVDLKRHSSLGKAVAVLSLAIRFALHLRRLATNRQRSDEEETSVVTRVRGRAAAEANSPSIGLDKKGFSASEREQALCLMILDDQRVNFGAEIRALERGEQVEQSSPIARLSPYLDELGIVRARGRLYEAKEATGNHKFPIILARRSLLSKLLVAKVHLDTMHGGILVCVSELRQKYWIIHCQNMVRQQVRECVSCNRYNSKVVSPIMGNLPAARVTPSPPFTHTGLDFGGPFTQRCTDGPEKVYIAIFVCFSTRAVHIELVGSLTSSGCTAALTRFVARRGAPTHMYSDNGTNFIGTRNELTALQEILDKRFARGSMPDAASDLHINWVTIPPRAPHWGGLWEAAVKSAKSHLRKVVGKRILTYEELSTLLCSVEAILNSRPLTPLSDDLNDTVALTPNMVIRGHPSHYLPVPPRAMDPNARLPSMIQPHQRWQHIQGLLVIFWRRWLKEYLHTLLPRGKWRKEVPNPKVGDIVLVTDDNVPPLQWPLARIIGLLPGADGVCRAVTLRTARGEYNRPVVKIRRLPFCLQEGEPEEEGSAEASAESQSPVSV